MLQNASYMFVFNKETKQNDYKKKEKGLTRQPKTFDVWNPRP